MVSASVTQTEKETRDEAIRIAELLSKSRVPAWWHDELIAYFAHRRAPFSGFLRAMLENNAALATQQYPVVARDHLVPLLEWLHAHAPAGSWRSEETVSTWLTPAHHLGEGR